MRDRFRSEQRQECDEQAEEDQQRRPTRRRHRLVKLGVGFAVVVVGKGAWVRRELFLRRQVRVLTIRSLVVEIVKVLQSACAEGKEDGDEQDRRETAQRRTVWPQAVARVNLLAGIPRADAWTFA